MLKFALCLGLLGLNVACAADYAQITFFGHVYGSACYVDLKSTETGKVLVDRGVVSSRSEVDLEFHSCQLVNSGSILTEAHLSSDNYLVNLLETPSIQYGRKVSKKTPSGEVVITAPSDSSLKLRLLTLFPNKTRYVDYFNFEMMYK